MAAQKKSKSTTKKKTAGAKKTGKKQIQDEREDGFLGREVVIIVFFALAVLLFLSNFHLIGSVGEFLRTLQLGVFGSMGFIFPLILFVGMAFAMSNAGSFAALRKLIAACMAFFVICAFCQIIFGNGAEDAGLMACYDASAINGRGGGIVGGAIVLALGAALGRVGTVVVLIVVFIICAVLITERSFVKAVRSGSGAVYRHAKDDYARVREDYEDRKAQRQEEQKFRGVNIGSTKLEDESEALLNEGAGTDKEDNKDARVVNDADDDSYEVVVSGAREVSQGRRNTDSPTDAAVFTGTITLPEQIDEDTVPFDESYEVNPEESAQKLVDEGTTQTAGWPDTDKREQTAAFSDDEDAEDDMANDERCYPANAHEPDILGSGESDLDLSDGEDEFDPDDMIIPAAAYDGYDKTTVQGGTFRVDGGEKRVVTSNGKVIDTDTEAVVKKVEKHRQDIKEESGEAGVAEEIKTDAAVPKPEYVFPPIKLLKKGTKSSSASEKDLRDTAVKLQQTLQNFGVGVSVTNVSCGPAVTRYELRPEMGVKVSRIVSLADDIKLALAAEDIRIEAPIPGKSAIGIEVPNKETNLVYLRDILESDAFKNSSSMLTFAVGRDISGQVVVTDIAKMPHLLIAGATGSGKSVCINTLIMSIIYKAKPEDVRMILIDPKVVELSVYNGIPHLLIPVVTDAKKAAGALNWAVAEMTDRYNKFARYNVRDLKGYNAKVAALPDTDDPDKPEKLPQILIIIDELADLMMVASSEVEDAICRIAQLARACGIHLVIATQRPSVNVITGLIKANIPSRIAFAVSSGVDSRTILDMNGAEKLLGKGDMLFYPAGYPKPQRVQGAFVSDAEVQAVVDFLTKQGTGISYNQEIEKKMESQTSAAPSSSSGGRDEYFADAGRFVIEKEQGSIGMLQRMFKIGFNRAARIMDQLADAGVVGEEEGKKPRRILMTMQEFEEYLKNS